MPDIGYYTLPVILSFDGIDKQVNSSLGKAMGGKKVGAQMGADIAAGLKSTESDVKQVLGGYSKLYDKWADATDKVKVAQAGLDDLQQKGINSGQRYERAIAANNKALRDQQRALREAKGGFEDYERAMKSAANVGDDFGGGGFLDKLKGMASGAKDSGVEAAGGFVEGFGGPIASIGTKGGPIGLALAAAAALGIGAGALIGKNVMAGLEQEAMADHFAAQLGLSENESAIFGKSAGKLYADNFGDSVGDVGQALADVQSTLRGASGAAIDDMTAKALTFRDVFGIDVAESIAHAQNLVVNGLAPDAATAFDLMTTAFQRVPAAMREELPEVLNEYSTNFQSLGFSAEEAFGILVKAAPQGKIVLDKIGDSLKEFMLLTTDLGAKPVQDVLAGMGLDGSVVANNLLAGGDTTQRQFDQIVDGLLSIQDPAQQASAAVALFGTPIEDLDKSKIPQFLSSLNDADKAMQGFSGSSQQMVDTVGNNTASSVETAKRALETGVSGMQQSMADAFGPGVEMAANWVVTHGEEITGFFTAVANGASEFGGVVLGVGAAVTSTFGWILQTMGDTTSFMLDTFATIAGGASQVADALGADGLAADLKNAQGNLSGMADRFDDAGSGVMAFAGTLANGAQNLHNFDANMGATQTSAQNTAAQIAGVKTAIEGLPGGRQINLDAVVIFKDQNGRAIDPSQLLGFNPRDFATAGDAQRARRGDSYTPGTVTSEVTSMTPGAPSGPALPPVRSYTPPSSSSGGSAGGGGGASASDQPPPYFDRSMWGVNPQSLGGYPGDAALLANVPAGRYTQEERGDLTQGLADCSSAVEDLVNLMDGRPTGGASMATGNADEWLRARGFVPGKGGLGDMRVAFNSGHMQATLPDGTPFNWGSDAAAARGGVGGTGADDPALTSRYYRPANSMTALAGTSGPILESGANEVDRQAVYDAETAVIKDEHALEQKRLALLELKAKGNASQSQILAAENDIEEQKRDLQSSQTKLAEAQKGKLQAAKSGPQSKAGGSSSGLGPLGEIFGSFLKETTGLDGSFLPDISGSPAMASLDALLGVLAPQIQAGGGGTSNTAFGMPDVSVPPPPESAQAGAAAAGAAAGGNPITIDQSINGNVGWDPAQVNKQRDEGLARAKARILTGS